ncbi:MAG: hypothetical protein HYZ81_18165 [Nitrospinae bacterium]|nr:hypothetical protein [Nitrospinota bacterium]
MKAYRAEIAARRKGLDEEQRTLQARMESARRGLAHVETLTSYCAQVRARLQTFENEEKRLALQALDIQVTWAIDRSSHVTGDAWRVTRV